MKFLTALIFMCMSVVGLAQFKPTEPVSVKWTAPAKSELDASQSTRYEVQLFGPNNQTGPKVPLTLDVVQLNLGQLASGSYRVEVSVCSPSKCGTPASASFTVDTQTPPNPPDPPTVTGLQVFVGAPTTPTPPGGLIQASNWQYVGAIRLPAGFEYASYGMVYNKVNDSLFITGAGHKTAEVTIPTPSNSNDLQFVPTAGIIQPLTDISEGELQTVGTDVQMGGYLLFNDELYFDGYVYYDGSGSQRLSHWKRSKNLSQSNTLVGPWGIVMAPWNITAPGYTSGPMGNIPPEWQLAFGGPAFASQCCIPILSRTSWGPSFMVWNPATFPNNTSIHQPILQYTQEHQLADYEDPDGNDWFSGPTQVHGAVFVDNTASILFFGRHGTGGFCYGHGTTINPPPVHPTPGEKYCYDPAIADKGNHTYPYHYQVWAYDANDLLKVKNGQLQYWEPKPYAFFRFTFPFQSINAEINGAAWDKDQRRVFLTVNHGDSPKPIIYVFKLN